MRSAWQTRLGIAIVDAAVGCCQLGIAQGAFYPRRKGAHEHYPTHLARQWRRR
jgi:predicted RNA methylase